MRNLLFIILTSLVFITQGYGQAMSTVNTRAKFKSLFIYQFTKYTEWPEDYKQGDFVIGVVNDNDLAEILSSASKAKKINSQNVIVKRISSTAEISKCHVLYVGGTSPSEVEPFINRAKQYNCLVITEGNGMVDRLSAINFVVVGNALKFEMNKQLFRDRGLTVSNSLENLATKVIN